ncbi:MAG TPA: MarR family winged helix-turn-helix transcriptional regulator [Acidobacteriaceae bacterium]|nr:MarR family winged helix-turn-helix transcriptional regulator [Acidobacteriaceae bacterium]
MYMQVSPASSALPCLCANVRRAARVLTQIYDDALRPLGLRSTQFSILQALSMAGPLLQGKLADILALDSTALTRAVQLLQKRGWIKAAKGKDRRERWLSLSQRGQVELAKAVPAWQKVQEELRETLGQENWNKLFAVSTDVVSLSRSIASMSVSKSAVATSKEVV